MATVKFRKFGIVPVPSLLCQYTELCITTSLTFKYEEVHELGMMHNTVQTGTDSSLEPSSHVSY